MTCHARGAIIVAILAAAGEVALAAATRAAWSPYRTPAIELAFLTGPLLFLALLAWRRCSHATRSRMLFHVAVVVAIGGLAVLGFDFARFRKEAPNAHVARANPIVVPLIQWAAVMVVWGSLVIRERQEKRAAKKMP